MNCRVETLYLSEIVGAEASAISVSGTRVSIMTKATLDAMAGRAEASAGRSWAPSPTQRAGTFWIIRGTLAVMSCNRAHLLRVLGLGVLSAGSAPVRARRGHM